MTTPQLKKTTYNVADDLSWVVGSHGLDMTPKVQLDISAFTEADHYPDGRLLPGIALGKITASGLYGPYAGKTNEVQTITVDATGGTYTVTFDGDETANIDFDATAAELKAALVLLPGFTENDLEVTGGPGDDGGTTPYEVTFTGAYAGQSMPLLTTDDTNLTGGAGTATVAEDTDGGSAKSDGTETATGYLATAVATDRGDAWGSQFVHGIVDESKLPDSGSMTNGGIDANGKADLAQIVHV